MNMNESEIAGRGITLLAEFLDDAYSTQEATTALTTRRAFVYRHARNIHDLADDLLFLASYGRYSSCCILMRPLFESLLNLVAAVKIDSFAAEKMLSEIHDVITRAQKWQKVANDDSMFRDSIAALEVTRRSLCSEVGTGKSRRWTTFDVAAAAEMEQHYIQDYFMYSWHSHATVVGIIAQENGSGSERLVGTTSYIVLASLGHAAQCLHSSRPQWYIDRTVELLERGNELARKRGQQAGGAYFDPAAGSNSAHP